MGLYLVKGGKCSVCHEQADEIGTCGFCGQDICENCCSDCCAESRAETLADRLREAEEKIAMAGV